MEGIKGNLSDIFVEVAKEYDDLEVEYDEYTKQCRCVLRNLNSRLENLQEEMDNSKGYNIIETVKYRTKTFKSTLGKLKRRGWERTMKEIRDMHDIAGVRIIVPFEDDIWKVKETLSRQQSLEIVEIRDYINHPKENGYKSLHLICRMTYHSYNGTHTLPIEIQIRTETMDVWASLEHKIRYKNPALELENSEEIEALLVEGFKEIADLLNQVDEKAMSLRDIAEVKPATDYL